MGKKWLVTYLKQTKKKLVLSRVSTYHLIVSSPEEAFTPNFYYIRKFWPLSATR